MRSDTSSVPSPDFICLENESQVDFLKTEFNFAKQSFSLFLKSTYKYLVTKIQISKRKQSTENRKIYLYT